MRRWFVLIMFVMIFSPVMAQDDAVDLTFFRDRDSLTVFVAEQGTVSLQGLELGVIRDGRAINLELANMMQLPTSIGGLPTPPSPIMTKRLPLIRSMPLPTTIGGMPIAISAILIKH